MGVRSCPRSLTCDHLGRFAAAPTGGRIGHRRAGSISPPCRSILCGSSSAPDARPGYQGGLNGEIAYSSARGC
ncbi:hypothetical protein [Streptosporangium sp. NPDC000396]|uniref:hypothetical protein n=1 Tax=Streptosporangium sp. NPDC000396 TaxID=3366185 RepID=UPI00368B3B22